MSNPCCAVTPAPTVRNLDRLTTVYSALADPIRLRLLALMKDGEVCVCHLHASLDVPQPTASRHLAYLRRSGLVEARRDGRWMHYKLAAQPDPVVRSILDAALHALTHADTSVRDAKRLRRVVA